MTQLLESLFFLSLGWVLLVFVLYPVSFAVIARWFGSPIRKDRSYQPRVSFVMAAYNEEGVIARRLQNYLDLDYPRELLEFHIGSDASTDRTDEIIREFQQLDPSIHLRRFERSGKTRIVYQLAEESRGDIIIFSDADVLLRRDAVDAIVPCFADQDVGGVVVRIVYEDDELNPGSVGERTYHGLEDRTRRNESMVYTTISPTGQCFAVRRGAFTPLTDFRMSDDLNLVITIPLNGKRVWFEPEAVAMEINRRTLWTEYKRRVRMGQQSMATYFGYQGTRWPWRSRVGAQIWGRKVPRNLIAIPALLLFITSLLLMKSGVVYLTIAILGMIWGGLVVIGLIFERLSIDIPILGYPLYFTLMLFALTLGSLRAFTQGGGLAMWNSPRLDNRVK